MSTVEKHKKRLIFVIADVSFDFSGNVSFSGSHNIPINVRLMRLNLHVLLRMEHH